ncbi:rRNA-processing protein Efg1p [Trichomonascus vanleenenianus]|uniref:Efg1p n=1 Tax=Trichomonascus vanleenenianus TaxID=2268995 RepID=UPI003ECB5428
MAKKKNLTEIRGVEGRASVSKLKKKLRDLERLLRNPRVRADKRVETERAIEALKGELKDAEKARKVKHTAQKYHMVRFFEKKKAARRLKAAIKRGDDAEEIRQCEIDYYYVLTFPIDEKYVSLYPNSDDNDDTAAPTRDKKSAVRKQVIEKIESGELKVGLDEDGVSRALKSDIKKQQSNAGESAKSSSSKKRSNSHKPESKAESEEEEDGFFE